jgi:hypothetical protein
MRPWESACPPTTKRGSDSQGRLDLIAENRERRLRFPFEGCIDWATGNAELEPSFWADAALPAPPSDHPRIPSHGAVERGTNDYSGSNGTPGSRPGTSGLSLHEQRGLPGRNPIRSPLPALSFDHALRLFLLCSPCLNLCVRSWASGPCDSVSPSLAPHFRKRADSQDRMDQNATIA